jgi:hypothetical protein
MTMGSARIILGRIIARCLWAAILCAPGSGSSRAADEVPVPDILLWDTGRASDGGEVDFGQKGSWRAVKPGATAPPLGGDVVVENERLVVVFCRASGGPLISPKSASARASDRSRIVPVTPSGEPSTRLTKIEIRKNDEEGVALEVSSRTQGGQEIRTAYALSPSQAFLECRPSRHAARIRVEAATRFAVIPDFFGADMVFDPRAYAQAKLIIPSENFVLGLLDGRNTIVMSVWPTGDQEAELVLAGAKADRRIAAIETTFHGRSVYVALLHAPGIWHEHRLEDPYLDQDVALDWTMPFAAKWRANFCRQRRNDSWDFQDRRTSTWMYLYQAIVWPCWFDGRRGFVRLSQRFIDVKGPMETVLVYPSDRKKDTPLSIFTPVDIVRNTLGVGPCEYVLDREGLQGRSANSGRKNFGRGVCDTTTPIEYLFIEGLETRESALVGHLVDDILADITAINARIHEFRGFGNELQGLVAADRRGAPHPADERESARAVQLLAEAEKIADQIEALYQERLPTIKDPAHADAVGRRIKQLASRSDPENLGECKTLTYELREIAGTQHRMVGDYRVMVKRLRQEAGILGAEDPATAKLAETVRKLGGQVLRKKYGVEAD